MFDEDNARLSDLTCTGLQLANFWQDVARDLAIGRIYLPAEDCDRFGYPDRRPAGTPVHPRVRLAAPVRGRPGPRACSEAGGTADRADAGSALAMDVDLFSRGGMAILDRIEARGFDVLSSRPEVGKLAKLGLLARALLARPRPAGPIQARALAGRAS